MKIVDQPPPVANTSAPVIDLLKPWLPPDLRPVFRAQAPGIWRTVKRKTCNVSVSAATYAAIRARRLSPKQVVESQTTDEHLAAVDLDEVRRRMKKAAGKGARSRTVTGRSHVRLRAHGVSPVGRGTLDAGDERMKFDTKELGELTHIHVTVGSVVVEEAPTGLRIGTVHGNHRPDHVERADILDLHAALTRFISEARERGQPDLKSHLGGPSGLTDASEAIAAAQAKRMTGAATDTTGSSLAEVVRHEGQRRLDRVREVLARIAGLDVDIDGMPDALLRDAALARVDKIAERACRAEEAAELQHQLAARDLTTRQAVASRLWRWDFESGRPFGVRQTLDEILEDIDKLGERATRKEQP